MSAGTAAKAAKSVKSPKAPQASEASESLGMFACPNPDCDGFNRFDAGNLSVCERTGKGRSIRRLYCDRCGCRFSERRGSLMQYTKLPRESVVRVVKCLTHGCSVEATADICEVDPRSVERLLERAGPRARDFHRLRLEKLARPPEVVEMDELHARVSQEHDEPGDPAPPAPPARDGSGKKGGAGAASLSPAGPVISPAGAGRWAAIGFTWPWRRRRGS